MKCRVVSWNIHACVGTDGRYDIARVSQVLESLNADIIGLQEVDWRRPPHDGLDALSYFAMRLGMRAVEGPNLHDHRGHYGNGLLSRFEVAGVNRIPLAYGGREPRGALDAQLQCEGRVLRTVVTHLGLNYQERREQLKTLSAALSSGSEATVLMGDMNEWRGAAAVARQLKSARVSARISGRSFPSRLPCFPLDAIFAGPAPLIAKGRVERGALARRASDHLPVVADLEWPPPV